MPVFVLVLVTVSVSSLFFDALQITRATHALRPYSSLTLHPPGVLRGHFLRHVLALLRESV